MKRKACSRCKVVKLLSQYHIRNAKADGRTPDCKSCRAVSMQQYYQKHADQINARTRQYRQDNRDHVTTLERARKAYYRETMADPYIRGLLVISTGLHSSEITRQMIVAKRHALQKRRGKHG